jgi:hypothetical protein
LLPRPLLFLLAGSLLGFLLLAVGALLGEALGGLRLALPGLLPLGLLPVALIGLLPRPLLLLLASAFLGLLLGVNLLLLLRPLFGFLPPAIPGSLRDRRWFLNLRRRGRFLLLSLARMISAGGVGVAVRAVLRCHGVRPWPSGKAGRKPEQGEAQAENQCLGGGDAHSVLPR